MSHTRDTRIVLDLKDRAVHFILRFELLLQFLGVADHGAEFVHGEQLSVPSDALLTEDRTAVRIVDKDKYVNNEKKRRENQQGKQGNDKVKGAFFQPKILFRRLKQAILTGFWFFRPLFRNR